MELYHALNRGVEKRTIFLDDQDRRRFVAALDLFNDVSPAENMKRVVNGTNVRPTRSHREPLVQIHGWCLMGNHYHLLLSEMAEGGITKFLMKLNVGYAKYFNERYKRSGTLFQGRTKKILIARHAHFLHILHYIHLNPLDQLRGTKEWREGRIQNTRMAFEHLDSYRWSSYRDYCEKFNFPELLTRDLFKEVFTDYPKTIKEYVCDLEIAEIKPLLLE